MLDIKRFRNDLNLNQKEFAEKVGLPQPFISRVEKGKDKFPEKHIINLKNIFDVEDFSKYIIDIPDEDPRIDELNDVIKSQQRTIENLSETLKIVMGKN